MGAAFESSPEEGYYGFGERYDTSQQRNVLDTHNSKQASICCEYIEAHAWPYGLTHLCCACWCMGVRFVGSTNNKGKDIYCWTEDGGWVFGQKARLPKERSTCTHDHMSTHLLQTAHGAYRRI
jgi:hypothetical protein